MLILEMKKFLVIFLILYIFSLEFCCTYHGIYVREICYPMCYTLRIQVLFVLFSDNILLSGNYVT